VDAVQVAILADLVQQLAVGSEPLPVGDVAVAIAQQGPLDRAVGRWPDDERSNRIRKGSRQESSLGRESEIPTSRERSGFA
jgi:hypothetical protein